MKTVVLFHSILGLRPVEHAASDRMRAAGYAVRTPDLYGGETAQTIEEGFELKERVGWPVICARAAEALADWPDSTVLAGISMGAGVVASLWPQRPHTAGVLLLHGLADIPPVVCAGLPAQVHVADPDPFAPPDQRVAWQATADRAGLAAQVFTYPGSGHFFIDPTLPDHDAAAARLTWQRALRFLSAL